MKKISITLTIVAFALALIPGCEKGNEYRISHGIELKDCPITQIIRDPGASPDTLVFVYNAWGDPVSVTKLPIPKTGSPNYVFYYDKKRRLTDIIGLYSSGDAETWHKYYYDNPGNSNITRDSTYVFVDIHDGVIVGYMYRRLTYYTYDKYDRIIKDSTISDDLAPVVNTYSYDASGNRVGRVYDNKINIHRTNKIWMFYDRDYSLNNAFTADTYNPAGLPTELNVTYEEPFMKFLREDFYHAQIKYGCR